MTWSKMSLIGEIIKKTGIGKAGQLTSPGKRRVLVLFGSQTGNAEFVAREASGYLNRKGFAVSCQSMGDYSPLNLVNESTVLIVVSTHGDGEPPAAARTFFNTLSGMKGHLLSDLRFGICALGDSSYPGFCQAGKNLETLLQKLGGVAVSELTECDAEFRDPAIRWIRNMYAFLSGNEMTIPVQTVKSVVKSPQKRLFNGMVTGKYPLYLNSSPVSCYHLTLQIPEPEFSFEPGDCIGILPQNNPILIHEILSVLGARSDDKVLTPTGSLRLYDALLHHYELTSVSADLLQRYYRMIPSPTLKKLLDDPVSLNEYIRCCDILDVLRDFPGNTDPAGFIGILRPLSPRLYSLTSSLKYRQDVAEIAVRSVKQEFRGRNRYGICSGQLCESLQTGEVLSFFVQRNAHFHLPEDTNAPVIMIGSGTGIAPFRAFIQERIGTDAKGKMWLIAGDRSHHHGFIYRDECYHWLGNRIPGRISVAYSRDEPERKYVQHCLQHEGMEFLTWLKEGAYIYICGSLKMSEGVKASLLLILSERKQLCRDEAENYLQELKRNKRYREDIYG